MMTRNTSVVPHPLFVSCVVFVCIFASAAASDAWALGVGGASVTLRESLLNSLQSELLPVVRDAVLSMELPEMCDKVGLSGIATLSFCMRHTKVDSIDFLPSSTVSVTSEGIEVNLDFWVFRVATDFDGTITVGFLENDQKGHLGVNMHRPNKLRVKLMVHSDVNSFPTVTIESLDLDFPLPTIDATGNMGSILRLWDRFAETIWDAVMSGLRGSLKPTIESALNGALKTMKWDMPLGELVTAHFWPSCDIEPSGSRKAVSAYSAAYFSQQKGTVFRPKKVPIRLPNAIERSGANVEIDFSEFTLSYFLAAYVGAGALSFTVRDKDLPEHFPIRLTTTFFRSVIPELYAKYPNREMTVVTEPSESPVVDIAEGNGGVLPSVTMSVAVYVTPESGRSEKVFALEVKAKAGLSPSVSSEGSQLRVSGRVSLASFTIRQLESHIGPIPVANVEQFIGGTLRNVVVPLVNVILTKGLLLPDHMELPLLETSRRVYTLLVGVANPAVNTRSAYASAAASVKTELHIQRK